MDTIWSCKSLEFEDLPTVRELLEEADEKILAREVASVFGRDLYEPLSSKRLKAVRKLARKAIREMKGLKPKRPSRKRVFLPARSFDVDARREQITVETSAQLFTRKDVMAVASGEHEDAPVPRAIEFEPWRKVLAFRIWLPEELSRRERYMALADIVIEMTFFGWSEKRPASRSKKALRELERSAAAVDSGKERLIPSELVFRELGLESSTDDYETEYQKRLDKIACDLNEIERAALVARVINLGNRISEPVALFERDN